jgi:hypothetical protein
MAQRPFRPRTVLEADGWLILGRHFHDGYIVTAGPVELKIWDISVKSYKLRAGRRLSVRFHCKRGVS